MKTRLRIQQKAAPRPSFTPVRGGLLQLKRADGGTPGPTGGCESCHGRNLQRAASQPSSFNPHPSEAPPIVHEVLRSPGQPLDAETRAFMEPRFGHDFSRVRVHADARAAESARMVNALAYSVGRDVVFGAGLYAPGTRAGHRLMAHELAHTIQQGDAQPGALERLEIGSPESGDEHEAGIASEAVMLGNLVNVSRNCAPQVAREPPPRDATPAPACPGPAKTVNVDLVSLRGSTRDAPADLDFANTVLAPCCVQFTMALGATVDAAHSDTWLGGDTVINTGTCGSATSEELDTYNGATTELGLSSRIRAFYVASISSGSRADSYPPYCATGTAAPLSGMVTVSNSGASRSLAHELGHILLNSATHPADTTNLMNPTNTATDNKLTPSQCATIYTNA
jgi:Domain of unknown function (DUF4157)